MITDAQPMAWQALYDHAAHFAATMGEDLAHEYASWFADEYQDDASGADHSSQRCFEKRQALVAAADAADKRSWFDRLCAEKGLSALPPATAGDIRRGQFLFTATGDPREVVRVKRTSRHTTLEYADGWRDSFGNDSSISFVAESAS